MATANSISRKTPKHRQEVQLWPEYEAHSNHASPIGYRKTGDFRRRLEADLLLDLLNQNRLVFGDPQIVFTNAVDRDFAAARSAERRCDDRRDAFVLAAIIDRGIFA